MKEEAVKILKKALDQLAKEKKKEEITLDVSKEQIAKLLEKPPSYDLGDLSFPCFFLAGKFKENPADIAMEIRKNMRDLPDLFLDIQTKGPYINFFINRKQLALNLISLVEAQKEKFGSNDSGKGRKILIEFSQPNTHKAFHVGHIRGTSVGESLSRIAEFSNSKVIRANYSGDTGMHIAKWIWCYKKYHSKEKLKNDESWIASIYVDAVKRLVKNEKLQLEVDEINRKIESREDKKINELWKKTRKLSIDSWKKIYEQLRTRFDVHYFESEVEGIGKQKALDLLEKKIAIKSDDAVIMDLKQFNLGVWVLLRKDGTVLYSAKDLALAERKVKEFSADDYLVVVGDEQHLHFQQLVKTLELMNFTKKDSYKFLTFGMVRLPTGKMSSRTGDNILYSDFIKEVVDYAVKSIKKRDNKILKKELEKRALSIAIAAVKFSMLKQSPSKTIIFNKEEALQFEGDTGPYLQYSYARASSILRKIKKKPEEQDFDSLDEKEEALTKKISEFSEIVVKAHQELNPSLIANYSYQLAQIFNEFYHACPVLEAEEKMFFRMKLVESFRQVLKNSLSLLGIDVLEEM